MEYDLYARGIPVIFYGSFNRQLAITFGGRSARGVMQKSQLLYRDIVLRLPFTGGRKNPNLLNVLIAAFAAAIYKTASDRLSPEQMGEIFSNAIEQTVAFKLFAKSSGKKNFTREWQDKRYAIAIESQKRVYLADFVSGFIYGRTVNEYGVKYIECGICKMMQRENCAELASQMCRFDYVTAKYMGCELTRTKTIANGDGMCDFWFNKRN